MNWTRRQSLQFGLGALAAASGLQGTAAQDYPSRPVTLVVPFAPGGGLDMIARQLQPLLEQRLGKPLLIENRPGAGTMIGAAAVAKAAPDGYTLLFGSASPLAIAVNVNKNPPYDPVRDFVPIAMIGNAAFVFVVTPDLGVNTLADFITLAKDNPRQLSFGSGGNGSIQHLFAELLQTMAGIRMVHVPYRGDNPVLSDIVAGHIPAAFVEMGVAMPFIGARKVRALAVSSSTLCRQCRIFRPLRRQAFPALALCRGRCSSPRSERRRRSSSDSTPMLSPCWRSPRCGTTLCAPAAFRRSRCRSLRCRTT